MSKSVQLVFVVFHSWKVIQLTKCAYAEWRDIQKSISLTKTLKEDHD